MLTEPEAAKDTAIAFVCFCLVSSGTYYLNDALDAESDRMHPTKRDRPVASGVVPVRAAIAGGILLPIIAIALSFLARPVLRFVFVAYLALTVHSTWLKHEAVLDMAAVAAGFVLRTIAGGVAVGVEISPWFLIVAGAGSVLHRTASVTRNCSSWVTTRPKSEPSLEMYSHEFLLYVRALTSSVAVLAYCLWAFEVSDRVGDPTWFELSIVPFVLAILRCAAARAGRGGAPEELLLSDRTLLARRSGRDVRRGRPWVSRTTRRQPTSC